MKNLVLIFLFFLTACSSTISRNDFNFTEDMSIDQFELKINEYGNNNPYPNIDD